MDTSGKGGTLRHTVGLIDPQGVRITSFKAPTEEERAHDFLWRIRKALPEPGYVGVFDRSHYEDVLIARVRELAPRRGDRAPLRRDQRLRGASWSTSGTTIVKCMLHISADEQKERLLARLDDPTKHWKFNPGDIDERALWPAYREAYEIALERTNTEHRAVARDPGRQEVVPQPGHRPAAARRAARHGPAVAEGRLRRRRAEAAAERRGPDPRDPRPSRSPATSRRCARAAACPASSRPTTSAPTSASSAAPARASRVLVAEVIVGELARRIGLATPRLVGARPRPRDRPLRGRRGGAGPAQRQRRAQPRRRLPARRVRLRRRRCPTAPDVAAKVLWLDAFCANVDRTWRNPNLLVWHGDLWVIDHGAALYFHHALDRRRHRPRAVRRASRGTPTDHVLLERSPAGSAAADAELDRAGSTEAVLAEVLAEVPDAWLEPVPGRRDARRRCGRRTSRFLTARLGDPAVAAGGGGGMSDRLAYQYVVLRCVPRVDREEFVNVGVVLYCQAADFLDVAWHVDADRLRALDPRLDLDQVCEALAFVDGRLRRRRARGRGGASSRSASASASSRRRAAPCSSPARSTAASPPTRPASSSTCSSAWSADRRVRRVRPGRARRRRRRSGPGPCGPARGGRPAARTPRPRRPRARARRPGRAGSPGARNSEATAMCRRPSRAERAHRLAGGRRRGGGVRRGDRQLVAGAPEPGQPGDGLVGERVGRAGGGEHERVELADPGGLERLAHPHVEHLEEAGSRPRIAVARICSPACRAVASATALGHVDLGVVGLGEQQRYDDDLVVAGPDQPVDDRLERRLGQLEERLLDRAGRGACALTSSTRAVIVAADRGSRLP